MFHHFIVTAIILLNVCADILKDFQSRSDQVKHVDVKSCTEDGSCPLHEDLSPNRQILGQVIYDVDHRDRLHPLVQFLNARSTAMNAKFR